MEIDRRLQAIDKRLVQAAKNLHVLSHLSWPASHQSEFLTQLAAGRPALPRVRYAKLDITNRLRELAQIADDASQIESPIARYLDQTARSYLAIGRLMERAGSREAGAISIEVYGGPGDPLPGSAM
ncbi:MAG: DUF1704 domain-containing protein, partial [Myxococcales bacterium]|nr:DUF1704 domain-containing protein [Myxococcales bacterium]